MTYIPNTSATHSAAPNHYLDSVYSQFLQYRSLHFTKFFLWNLQSVASIPIYQWCNWAITNLGV